MKLRHLGFILFSVIWIGITIQLNQLTNNEASYGESLGVAVASLMLGPVIVYYGIFYLYDKLQDRKMDNEIRSAI